MLRSRLTVGVSDSLNRSTERIGQARVVIVSAMWTSLPSASILYTRPDGAAATTPRAGDELTSVLRLGSELLSPFRAEHAAAAHALDRLERDLLPRTADGAPYVIVGPNNAGKSALFNALVGYTLSPSVPTGGATRRLIGAAPEGWVGLSEAARRLGLSKSHVVHLVKSGKLNAVRATVGKRQCWRIDVDSATCGKQVGLFDPMCNPRHEGA